MPTGPDALDVWAREALGLWKKDRDYRRAEHDCVRKLKAQGVIR